MKLQNVLKEVFNQSLIRLK